MAKAILTIIVTLVIGVVCAVLGNDFLNGFTELGTIAAVAVTGGLVVFFNEKKSSTH